MELNEYALNLVIENIKKLLRLNKIKESFELLDRYIAPISDDLATSIILNNGSFNALQNKINNGLITPDNAEVRFSQISYNLIKIMDDSVPTELEVKRIMGEIKPSIYHATKDANLEKILGSNNLLKISWLERAILKSKSVCQIRLINNDRAIGTGFVLKGGYLMTNCHVIPNKSAVDNVKIIFDFEEDLLGQVRKTFEYRLDKNDATFSPIAELDYAYIKIIDNPANPLAQWGHLEIEITVPQVDDAVTIIQHPLGQVKQIALTANEVIGINDQKLLYKTDTERGSSGSPVFNNHWKVIALHHAGKTEEDGGLVINPVTGERRGANEGILMNKIAQKLTIVVNP